MSQAQELLLLSVAAAVWMHIPSATQPAVLVVQDEQRAVFQPAAAAMLFALLFTSGVALVFR
jgi:hypothetical protein